MKRLGVGALCLLALGACGGDVSFDTDSDGEQLKIETDPLQDLLALSVSAPWTTMFQGTRRVELRYFNELHQEITLAYREAVSADGAGNFALDTVEVLSFLPDPNLFQVLQDTRQGFLYRYRDFAIHDLAVLYQSYVASDQGNDVVIAGRPAREVHISLDQGQGSTFEVYLDTETGLPLKSIERDASGIQVALMEFESFDPTPDLTGTAWYQAPTSEIALDPLGDLTEQAGFEVFVPAVLPDHYQPWKATTLVDGNGQTWIKQTFTDGVQPLFLLHRDGVVPPAFGAGGQAVAASAVTDDLYVYPMGPVMVVEGILRGRRVVALGKVDAESLLDLLESAID